jgi:hypothetical protein
MIGSERGSPDSRKLLKEGNYSPSPNPLLEEEGIFPLLHFLLPPGEGNRGKGLHRERKIKEGNFLYADF